MSAKDLKDAGVPVLLDKERHLKFDFNAFCEIEEKFGSVEKAFDSLEGKEFKSIRFLLWVALIHEDESLTEKEAGKLFTLRQLPEVTEAIVEALSKGLPEAKN